jgi:hypothetical protein
MFQNRFEFVVKHASGAKFSLLPTFAARITDV